MKQLKTGIYMQAVTTFCTKITAIYLQIAYLLTESEKDNALRHLDVFYPPPESTGCATSNLHGLRSRPYDHNANHSSTKFILEQDLTRNDLTFSPTINKYDVYLIYISGQFSFFAANYRPQIG